MSLHATFTSKTSKRLAVAVAIVLAAAGGTVVASTNSSTVTICVNKQTGAMRQETRGNKCKTSTESSLVINKQGPQGPAGATGATGAAGVKITELSVCDSPDADTIANELCKVGMTGPGGGPVFFVDYFDQYASFCASGAHCNYLEASPADVDEIGGDFTSAWCSNTATSLGISNWSHSAIGAGRTNTATADTTCTNGAIQVAVDYVSPAFNGVTKDDWWLPSIGELMVMHSNLRQAGAGNLTIDYYWSSSENHAASAWFMDTRFGDENLTEKTFTYRVRPVRGF